MGVFIEMHANKFVCAALLEQLCTHLLGQCLKYDDFAPAVRVLSASVLLQVSQSP
jgi:hypothetical protein